MSIPANKSNTEGLFNVFGFPINAFAAQHPSFNIASTFKFGEAIKQEQPKDDEADEKAKNAPAAASPRMTEQDGRRKATVPPKRNSLAEGFEPLPILEGTTVTQENVRTIAENLARNVDWKKIIKYLEISSLPSLATIASSDQKTSSSNLDSLPILLREFQRFMIIKACAEDKQNQVLWPSEVIEETWKACILMPDVYQKLCAALSLDGLIDYDPLVFQSENEIAEKKEEVKAADKKQNEDDDNYFTGFDLLFNDAEDKPREQGVGSNEPAQEQQAAQQPQPDKAKPAFPSFIFAPPQSATVQPEQGKPVPFPSFIFGQPQPLSASAPAPAFPSFIFAPKQPQSLPQPAAAAAAPFDFSAISIPKLSHPAPLSFQFSSMPASTPPVFSASIPSSASASAPAAAVAVAATPQSRKQKAQEATRLAYESLFGISLPSGSVWNPLNSVPRAHKGSSSSNPIVFNPFASSSAAATAVDGSFKFSWEQNQPQQEGDTPEQREEKRLHGHFTPAEIERCMRAALPGAAPFLSMFGFTPSMISLTNSMRALFAPNTTDSDNYTPSPLAQILGRGPAVVLEDQMKRFMKAKEEAKAAAERKKKEEAKREQLPPNEAEYYATLLGDDEENGNMEKKEEKRAKKKQAAQPEEEDNEAVEAREQKLREDRNAALIAEIERERQERGERDRGSDTDTDEEDEEESDEEEEYDEEEEEYDEEEEEEDDQRMEVYLSGRYFVYPQMITVKPSWTVLDLKKYIQRMFAHPVQKQRLFLAAGFVVLSDEGRTLMQYGVNIYDSIRLDLTP